MIKSHIIDSDGTGSGLNIVENAALTTVVPFPPIIRQKSEPFKQFLTVDGLSTGSSDMSVDGSSTNQEFYITASNTSDRYITSISIIIGYSASGKPFQWADTTALTNGIRFFYESQRGTIDIDSAIKSNSELLRLANDNIINSDWEVRHVGALNDYGYFIKINLNEFSPYFGIKLDKGSNQRLVMNIRDDVTAATTFNTEAIGFDRFE